MTFDGRGVGGGGGRPDGAACQRTLRLGTSKGLTERSKTATSE